MAQFLKVFLIILALVAGASLFAVRRATTIDRIDARDAAARFNATVAQFEDTEPMLQALGGTEIQRRRRTNPGLVPTTPSVMKVMAWRGPRVGLVQVDVPIWLLRMKGPALRFLLRDTSFDLKAWGLTADDLEEYGPGLIIDYRRARGDRLLIWTE